MDKAKPGNGFLAIIKQSLNGENYDFTQGSIRKAVVLLAIPMMLEMCLESVFAVVDIYFVNKLGKHAVSVVGLTEAVITLVYSAAIGLSAAATAVVARRVGEKNPEGAAAAAAQTLIISCVLIAVLSVTGFVFSEELLRMMGAEEETVAMGVNYTRTMMGGCGVIVLLFLINGIFRGAGNAAVAMRSLWIANACNIILCPVLINGYGPFPEMGVTGAAVATTVGRGIGVIYQLFALFNGKNDMLLMLKAKWTPQWETIKSIGTIALPATIQFIIQSASWIVLAGIIARSGSDASAGYQTAIRVVMFFLLPAWGISNAAATLVGQNLGAKSPERAEQSVLTIAKYNTLFMAVVSALCIILAHPMMAFFIEDESSLQFAYAIESLRIVSAGFVIYALGMVLMQAFNGAGDTKTPTYICIIGFWIFQIPFAYWLTFVLNWGPTGAFLAVPAAEGLISLMYWYMFRKGKWKMMQV